MFPCGFLLTPLCCMVQVLQISKEHVRARALLHKARQYKDKKEQGARYKYSNYFLVYSVHGCVAKPTFLLLTSFCM
jgi:hypothetical protein